MDNRIEIKEEPQDPSLVLSQRSEALVYSRQSSVSMKNVSNDRKTQRKKNERPVVHRRTGIISVGNYQRSSIHSFSNKRDAGKIAQSNPMGQTVLQTILETIVLDSTDEDEGEGESTENPAVADGTMASLPDKGKSATPKKDKPFCDVCQQSYVNRRTFEKHQKSRKHATNVEK